MEVTQTSENWLKKLLLQKLQRSTKNEGLDKDSPSIIGEEKGIPILISDTQIELRAGWSDGIKQIEYIFKLSKNSLMQGL